MVLKWTPPTRDVNRDILSVIAMLKSFKMDNVFNPWTDKDPLDSCCGACATGTGDCDVNPLRAPESGPEARVARLREHFDVTPRWLLIGEAPGYQGCHFSGVPFTNESLLCEGKIPRLTECHRFTSRPKPWREPSATIVWDTLWKLGIAETTVMWNAFPFHPHKPGDLYSNRAPTRLEVSMASDVTRMVLTMFEGAQVICVGQVASKALTDRGIYIAKTVRHPSMGGASRFREQMESIVKKDITG